MEDVKKLRELDKDTVQRYKDKIDGRRLWEMRIYCCKVFLTMAVVLGVLVLMTVKTKHHVKLGNHFSFDCEKPDSLGYSTSEVTFTINDTSRKVEGKTKRTKYFVYPCQKIKITGTTTHLNDPKHAARWGTLHHSVDAMWQDEYDTNKTSVYFKTLTNQTLIHKPKKGLFSNGSESIT